MDMSRWVLQQLLPARRETFHGLVKALARDGSAVPYTLAGLNDFLTALSRDDFVAATSEPAPNALDPYLANYVAAMIETAAHRHAVPPPSWTSSVPPLAIPAFGSPLAGLRLHLLIAAPPAFRRRNIFIDSSIGDRV
ncbi:MAG TPA: hypothetical protein VMV37_00550 [Gammaproteobacteria bacterium]|nr:hypothetical protein [Gammaproteobacteria bacterium]